MDNKCFVSMNNADFKSIAAAKKHGYRQKQLSPMLFQDLIDKLGVERFVYYIKKLYCISLFLHRL